MMITLTRARPAFLAMLLLAAAGCQLPDSIAKTASPVATAGGVEVVDDSPRYTPEERLLRFRQAFAAGNQWVARNEYGLALGAFEEALNMRPDSIDAMFNLAACYEQIGEPTRAIALYKKILAVAPNDAECYHNLGTSYIKLYHLEKSPTWRRLAERAWRRSLEINPQQPRLHAYLAGLSQPAD